MNKIPTKEELMNYEKEKFEFDKSKCDENFIITPNALERLEKINNLLDSDIPIILEGPTGTSKTKTIEELCKIKGFDLIKFNLSSETTSEDLIGRLLSDKNQWSGFSFFEGPFIKAFNEGKVFLLDEVNLASKTVLQMLESAIDYGEISQEVPGRNFLYYEKNPNFRIIATQNPITGNFIHKREELSEKFLQRFQIIEFPSLEIEELKLIALGLAKSRNFKDKNIINIITDFHHKWINDKSSLASPQGFTIRELNITINAISKKKLMIPAISAIRCFYSQRYEKKEREKIENILSNYSNFYQKEIIPEIEYNIPFCYHSESIKRVFYYSKISIENGRHLLLVGNQGNGLTQIGKWIAEAFSINKDNSFCFIFTPQTSISDLIGKYFPNKK